MTETSYEVNAIRLDRVNAKHLKAFMQASLESDRYDLTDVAGDIKGTSIVLEAEVVGETEKAWKVKGHYLPSFYIGKHGGQLTGADLTQWLPKSHCSIVSDNLDSVAIIPNWLMRNIAQDL